MERPVLFLSLRADASFVRGPVRSALYDLTARRIWPLDPWMTRLIGNSLGGQPLAQVLKELGVRSTRSRRFVLEALSEHPLLRVSPQRPAPAGRAEEPRVRLPLVGDTRRAGIQPVRRGLEFLWLELTGRCNLRCVHCYAGSGPDLSDGPMRTREHLRVLQEAARAGCRSVQFTGGEALLDPGLPSLVDEARALGYEWVEVYSNATLLTDDRVRFLKDRGVRLAVSFYTHREHIHDSITRVQGSFRRSVRAIRALVEAGVAVRVGIVRLHPNQGDVDPARDLLVSLGIQRDQIGVDDVRPAGRGCGDSLAPAAGQSRSGVPPMGEHVRPEAGGRMGCRTCWSGKVAVAPSGDVYPCVFSRELNVGNVLHRPLAEVLGSEPVQELWSIDKEQIPVCRECEFRYGCFDCRALAHKQTGVLRSKPPTCSYDPRTGSWRDAAPPAPGVRFTDSSVPVREASLRWVRCGDLGLLHSRVRTALLAVNRVATEVVSLCNGIRSVESIARSLSRRYLAPEMDVSGDVRVLLAKLSAAGLVGLRPA